MRFYFELALKLGMGVESMLDSMSSYEITGWKLLFEVKADEEQRRDAMRKGGNAGGAGGSFFD